MHPPTSLLPALLLWPLLQSCAATPETCPIAGARPADELILPAESHFEHLWQLTLGGENAEAYWSFDGTRLCLQRRPDGSGCDRIFVTDPAGGPLLQLSDGRGTTTCAYFLPGDEAVLFSSTQGALDECPPPPDFSQGYVWRIFPEHEVWVHDLESGAQRVLIGAEGYDAEATVSPRGDRIVFTSTRSGDLELWTCDLEGGDLLQVTDALGYDGGAFFSHDGEQLVFRATQFTPGDEAREMEDYRRLLSESKVRPGAMEIMLVAADGTGRRQLTRLGGANFAPSFFPDDQRVVFSSNHHAPEERNFDLFAVGLDGEAPERITYYEGFDSFPLFSPDGRYLVFASNRGQKQRGETNVFIARWR